MLRLSPSLYLSVATLTLLISGCGTPAETGSPAARQSADGDGDDTHPHPHPHTDDEHADHSAHDSSGMTDMEKMKVELAKLSPEEAASAEKQHFCPVTGDMLGTMGPPIKVDVDGRQVWICCEGCRDQLLEDPDQFLAKLSD